MYIHNAASTLPTLSHTRTIPSWDHLKKGTLAAITKVSDPSGNLRIVTVLVIENINSHHIHNLFITFRMIIN